jgi:hypothetical protein
MLLNLPSSGIISSEPDGAVLTWSRKARVVALGRTDASTQVLKPSDPTDALTAMLKSKKARNTSQKRPREENQGGGHAKRPNILTPSLPALTATATAVQPQPSAVPNRGSLPLPLAPSTSLPQSLPDRKAIYSLEDLRSKNTKQLQDILKSKGLTLSGNKDQLIQRIIDFQRRQKIAQQGR